MLRTIEGNCCLREGISVALFGLSGVGTAVVATDLLHDQVLTRLQMLMRCNRVDAHIIASD